LWCLIECMNMKKIKNKLSAYLDGELDRQQAREMELLIKQDPVLRSEYEQLREIYGFLDRHRQTLTDPFFKTRFKVRLQQTREAKTGTLKRHNWLAKLLLPGSVVAGLIVGMALGFEIQDKVMDTGKPADNEIARKYFGGKVLSTIPEGSITENYIKLSSQVK